jgi:hypothetical protein
MIAFLSLLVPKFRVLDCSIESAWFVAFIKKPTKPYRGDTKVDVLRDSHKLLVTPYREFEQQCGGKTVLAGLRLKKQLMVVSKITFEVWSLIWFFPSHQDGANFDASFRQILGMESEILWESDIRATLERSSSSFRLFQNQEGLLLCVSASGNYELTCPKAQLVTCSHILCKTNFDIILAMISIVYGSPAAGSPNNWAAIVGWLGGWCAQYLRTGSSNYRPSPSPFHAQWVHPVKLFCVTLDRQL